MKEPATMGDLPRDRRHSYYVDEFLARDVGHSPAKVRLRRLYRQMRRRRLLKDIECATVLIASPTHFAVALRYRREMPVPVVVAKGANTLADQIRQAARGHEIPIAENPPLAHELYRSVKLGQAIPRRLYACVAEVLAFVVHAREQARWQ
jgi:flagellar biosynthetic protein FlhB